MYFVHWPALICTYHYWCFFGARSVIRKSLTPVIIWFKEVWLCCNHWLRKCSSAFVYLLPCMVIVWLVIMIIFPFHGKIWGLVACDLKPLWFSFFEPFQRAFSYWFIMSQYTTLDGILKKKFNLVWAKLAQTGIDDGSDYFKGRIVHQIFCGEIGSYKSWLGASGYSSQGMSLNDRRTICLQKQNQS